MKIVIPTAGFGTRLRPHTWSKPKPLVSVAGKPVLGHVLDMFRTVPDVDEVVFIIGYLGEQIEEYVSEAYPDLPTRYVVQEQMLGQSHAIWLAREGLEGPMLMAFVDTLIDVDLSFLADTEVDAIAWVKEVEDPRRFGVADLNEQGRVERLVEKPEDLSNNLAVVGFYYFKEAKELLSAIEKQIDSGDKLKGEFYLADAINYMLNEGLEMRVETVDVWEDCGKPEPLLKTNRYLLDHGRDNSDEAQREGSVIVPPVSIHPSAELINAVVGPHASIGADCKIERASIRNSIVEDRTSITDAQLEGSVIGRDVTITGADQKLNVGDNSDVTLS
ncbi:MAG: sugar phosphate nucleotidyltransferase [Anaerolineales bacterium]